MRIDQVLHRNLLHRIDSLHAVRAWALTAGVEALVNEASLTVTTLGRSLDSPALTKHHIKCMDRLLSNPPLQTERKALCARCFAAGYRGPSSSLTGLISSNRTAS